MSVAEPLRVPGFARLLATYTINELGDVVGLVALAVLVYDGTGGAVETASLFVAARFLPALLAPALVARVDAWPPRRVLPVLYVAEAAAFGGLALLAESFSLVAVLALALVDGTLAIAGRGITRGAVATVLTPHGALRRGNGLLNVGFALSSVGGAVLGGALVSSAGVQAALLLDAGSFLVAAAVVATATGLRGVERDVAEGGGRLREALAFARRHRVVRIVLGAQSLALVLFTLIVPIEVIYARETLNAGNLGFGLLLASWGAGIVAGSAAFLRMREWPTARLALGSTAAVGVAYLGMALTSDLRVACAVSVLGGLGNGIQWVSVVTLVQERVPMDLQARVSGLLESVGAAMPGVGFVLGGALTAATSPPVAYATAAAGLLALVAAGVVLGAGRRGALAPPDA